MENLDEYTSEYQKGSDIDIEADLILNWYPDRILKKIKSTKNKKLLELGLGHGYTTNKLTKYFKSHTVLEGSSKVIDMFREEYPDNKANIIETFFENYKTNEKFDVIIMGFILEHVDNPKEILESFRPYLKEDGQLFIAVPNAKSMNRRLGLSMGKIDDIYSLNEKDISLGHKRNFLHFYFNRLY